MLFKISLKNIKKSIKDYSIYFFTLVFAVSIFYIFNSIDAQSSMLNLTSSKHDLVKTLVYLLNYVSIFVSVILGFLIVYSNNFLIKKRKKEIGIYLTLGMSKRKVSLILAFETLVIGIFSLGIGLLVGLFLSQFLSIFTAKLFAVDMTKFKFVFSSAAFIKTIIYFGLIFICVLLFSILTLSRYKLIDLLTASKKNEKVKIRNKYVTIITFLLACGFLGYAYYLLFDNVLVMLDYKTTVMIACGIIGTFLLFYSLAGFLLKVIQQMKKLYYKNLNMFILKQVNNKINTTVISTTVICIMLLLTIGILSCSITMEFIFNANINDNNLQDYTMNIYSDIGKVDENGNIINEKNEVLNKVTAFLKSDELKKYTTEFVNVHIYNYENLIFKSIMTEKDVKKLQKEYGSALSLDFNVSIISESDYRALMELQHQKYIDIKDNEYLLFSNLDFAKDAMTAYYESKQGININNNLLIPATDQIIVSAMGNSNVNSNDGVIVISDELIYNMPLVQLSVVGNFTSEYTQELVKLNDEFYNYASHELHYGFDYRTKVDMENSSIGIKSIMIFVGLYLGITFAISSATILAIGQLSESSDNRERYRVLKQLGASNEMINRSLFTQILIVFIFPLIVALIHAYFGLREINSLLVSFGSIDLTSNIILVTLFMIIIYGGYFMFTYLWSKNIIKNN